MAGKNKGGREVRKPKQVKTKTAEPSSAVIKPGGSGKAK